jgi:hypothetical protein
MSSMRAYRRPAAGSRNRVSLGRVPPNRWKNQASESSKKVAARLHGRHLMTLPDLAGAADTQRPAINWRLEPHI